MKLKLAFSGLLIVPVSSGCDNLSIISAVSMFVRNNLEVSLQGCINRKTHI